MIIMSGKFDLDLIEVIRTYICFGIYPLTYLHEALTVEASGKESE